MGTAGASSAPGGVAVPRRCSGGGRVTVGVRQRDLSHLSGAVSEDG